MLSFGKKTRLACNKAWKQFLPFFNDEIIINIPKSKQIKGDAGILVTS